MPLVMILYYIILAFITGILLWIFISEKKDKEKMILSLIILIPLLLRLFRIR